MTKTRAGNWCGKTIAAGRFEVNVLLGEGGMGQAYRARDRKYERDVVIKVPHLVLLRDPEFAKRFQREIESLRQLTHPHIVPVLCGGLHSGIPFVVLRFMPDGSLAEKIESTSLSDRIALLDRWLPQIADALDFVHASGFIHRDVKPDNIFLDEQGLAYLGDFGIVKAASEATDSREGTRLTMTGTVIGTPEYMAPEMAMGEDYDHRSDQYSLAVTAYESLDGTPPFQGPTPAAILVKLTTTQVPDLSSKHARITAGLSDAVSHGLSKEPGDRFDSCSKFATAVTQADDSAAGESAAADPASEFTDWQETTQTAAFTTTAPHDIRPTRRRSKSRKQPLLDPETPFAPLINPVLVRFRKARKKHGLTKVVVSLCCLFTVMAAGGALIPGLWSEPADPDEGLVDGASETRIDSSLSDRQPNGEDADAVSSGLVNGLLASQAEAADAARKTSDEVTQENATAPDASVTPSEDVKPVVVPKPPSVPTVAASLTLTGHTARVNSVAFSPDGKRIASSSDDGTARVWDAASGAQLIEGKVSIHVASVAFGPEGKWIASDNQELNTVDVWDSATGKERPRRWSGLRSKTRHRGQMSSVAYSLDGKWLASGSWDKTVKLWDARTGAETQTLPHSDLVIDVAFRPDSKQVASGSKDGTVNLWNANTGERTLTLKHSDKAVLGVAFRSDHKQIASASSDGTVKLWDVATGQESLMLKENSRDRPVYSVTFSPDGQRLASANYDGTVKLWDTSTGSVILTLKEHTSPVMDVAFRPDGNQIASASADRSVKLWDVSLATKGPTTNTTSGSVAMNKAGNPTTGSATPAMSDAQRSAESLALEGKRAGEEWSTNGPGMPFCWCPAGTFAMGSPRNEPGREVDEDQVQVTLSKGYWLARHETTQQLWQQVMSQSPWSGQFDGVDGKDLPATHVTWNLAMEFCQKLTASERQAGRLPSDWMYSLPTEAQWEYACRASTRTPYWFGADTKDINDCSWNRFNANGAIYAVGTKRANPWGLHDVTGNAWEWCRDYASTKLPGKTDPEVIAGGSRRALKGGGFLTSRGNYRSGDRSSLAPEIGVIGNPAEIGFRVALVRDSREISIPEIQPGPPRVRVIRNGEIFTGVRRYDGITETTGFRMTARKGHRITVEVQYNQRLDANGQTSVLGLIQYFDGVIVGNTMDLLCRRVNQPAFANNVGWRIQLSVSDGKISGAGFDMKKQ